MILSKLNPKFEGMSCKVIAHPWTDNCFLAAANTWLGCFLGSAGFFGILYTCQYLSTFVKKKKKAQLKDFLYMHIRSTAFGATLSTCTFAFHCVLRNLLGRYHTVTVVFIPAMVAGYTAFMEAKRGRELFCNSFANCSLEIFLRDLEKSNILRWNPNIRTVIFMLVSSFLSSLLVSTNFDSNYFWFFMPPKAKKGENEKAGACFHEGNCQSHIINLFVMYSATGFVLQFLNLVFTNFKNPMSILFSIAKAKTFKLSAFLGGYVVVYQAIRCFLYQKEKKYSYFHDTLAGFLAGITFRFQPTTPIFNSAFITTVQILTEMGCKEKILPDLPYLEIMFSFFCGLLFHHRILGDECPQLLVYTMRGVTNGLSDRVAYRYKSFLRKLTDNLKDVPKSS